MPLGTCALFARHTIEEEEEGKIAREKIASSSVLHSNSHEGKASLALHMFVCLHSLPRTSGPPSNAYRQFARERCSGDRVARELCSGRKRSSERSCQTLLSPCRSLLSHSSFLIHSLTHSALNPDSLLRPRRLMHLNMSLASLPLLLVHTRESAAPSLI